MTLDEIRSADVEGLTARAAEIDSMELEGRDADTLTQLADERDHADCARVLFGFCLRLRPRLHGDCRVVYHVHHAAAFTRYGDETRRPVLRHAHVRVVAHVHEPVADGLFD